MKLRVAILTIAMLPTAAMAQQPRVISEPASAEVDPRQAQIQAATANGIASLRDQVLRTKLSRNLNVGDFLDQTKSTDELDGVLQAAQPVGGPRWVDDHTCQVRLELPGPKLSAFLIDIARDDSRHSEIKPDVLKAKLSDWKGLKFVGVGSSAGGDSIELARPRQTSGKWCEVSDSSRRQAIAQARADAVRQVINSIGPMSLDGKTLASDALARAAISQRMNTWLQRQPVTKIEFLDDLKVSVTVSVVPRSLASALKSAVDADSSFNRDLSVDWPKVASQIEMLPASFAGSATALVEGRATSLPSIVLPLTPPDWADQQLDAEGTATQGGQPLKVGRLAEANAIGKIREKFLLLHIDSGTTLGDAAKSDQSLNAGIDRALLHARTTKVDYNSDGSVRVRISLDLRDAWDELRANP